MFFCKMLLRPAEVRARYAVACHIGEVMGETDYEFKIIN